MIESKKFNLRNDDIEKAFFTEGIALYIEEENTISKDSKNNEEEVTNIESNDKHEDIPERILIKGMGTIEEEASWLKIKFTKANPDYLIDEESFPLKIISLLKLNKEELLDVPYIATYKKYIYQPELSFDQVYEIFSYEKEYFELLKYKAYIINQFNAIAIYLNDYPQDFEIQYITKAFSLNELDDIRAFIHYFKESHLLDKSNKALQKIINSEIKPIVPSIISQLTHNKLNEFASAFALPMQSVAFNLQLLLNEQNGIESDNNCLILSPEPNDTPAKVSAQYLNNSLNEELKILTQGCKFLAIQLSSHPYIRRYVMEYYYKNAVLSTHPTPKGKDIITVDHLSFRVKYIKEMPIFSFNPSDSDLYLDIIESEKKKLITVSIDIKDNKEEYDDLVIKLSTALYPNKKSSNEMILKAWNIMREESLRMLIREVCLSVFKTKIRSELKSMAESNVIKHSQKEFSKLLLSHSYGDEQVYPVVFSFTYDPSESKVYTVMMNGNGEVEETFCLNYISLKLIGLKKEEKAKYHQELTQCLSLINKYKPSVIVIGANDLICRYIKDQLSALTTIPIEFRDMSIAKVYADSKYAKEIDKQKHSEVYFQSIGLGRLIQSPLETMVSMWEDTDDIEINSCLRVEFHPFQHCVNPTYLETKFKSELIKAVNLIGVDQSKEMNPVLKKKMLSLISGLSSNKIKHLLNNNIKNREELKHQLCNFKIILFNCNGFIRYSSSKHILDKTRIPLAMYPIAQDALSYMLKKKITDDYSTLETIENAEIKLSAVTIDDCYINCKLSFTTMSIEESKFFLELLMKEILNPFQADLIPFKSITIKETVLLFINDPYFAEGIMTTAKVIRLEDTYIKCSLFNGLDASILFEDTSDNASCSQSIEEIKQQFNNVLILKARVKQINWDNQTVFLTLKQSLLLNHKEYLFQIKNKDHFDYDVDELKTVDVQQSLYNCLTTGEKKLIARKIPNEKFKNYTLSKTTEFLLSKTMNEYVLRPCYLGEYHLTLTYKIENSIFVHHDIKQDKSTLHYHLLNNEYTDLRDLTDKYILPCISLYNSARRNRKYISIDNYIEFERKLKCDKTIEPNLIHYNFTILKEFPGYIVLGYTPKAIMVNIEYIKVSPGGYEFHNQKFISIDDVIGYLKRHYGSDEYNEYLRKIKPPVIDYGRNCERDYKEIDGLDLVEGNVNTYSNKPFRNNNSCRYCKEEGHVITECPKIKDKEHKGGFTKNKRLRDEGGKVGWGINADANMNNSNNNSNEVVGWGTNAEKKDDKMIIEAPGWSSVNQRTDNNDTNLGWGTEANMNQNEFITLESNKVQTNTSERDLTKKEDSAPQGWGNTNQQGDIEQSWGNTDKKETTNEGWGNSNQNELTYTEQGQDWGNNSKQKETTDAWGTSNNNQWDNSKDNKGYNQQKRERNQQWERNPKSNYNRNNNNSQRRDNYRNNNQSNSEWGAPAFKPKQQNDNWQQPNSDIKNEDNNEGWGKINKEESIQQGWGSTDNKPVENTPQTGWNNNNKTEDSIQQGWGSTDNKPVENTPQTGWDNNNKKEESTQQGWGINDNTKNDKANNSNNAWNTSGNSNWNTPNNNNTGSNWGSLYNEFQSKGDGFKKPNKNCYNCGEEGHNSRDCPHPKKERPPLKCYNCGEEGHGSRNCTQPKIERPPLKCYNCGEEGHGSRNCTQPKIERPPMKCYNCGEEGHGSRNCTQPKKERSSKCFKCGEEGHKSHDCPKQDSQLSMKCFNCGEEGHNSRDCTQPRKERSSKCYNCDEVGHNSRDCPNPRNERKKSCYNCGSDGHMSFQCTEPKNERGRGRGRGSRGQGRGGRGRGGYDSSSNKRDISFNWNSGIETSNQWNTGITKDNWRSSSNNDNVKDNTQAGWEESINTNNKDTSNNDTWGNAKTTNDNNTNAKDQGWGNTNIGNDNSNTKDQGWDNTANENISKKTETNWGNSNDNQNTDQAWGVINKNDNWNDNTKYKSQDTKNNEGEWETSKPNVDTSANNNWLSSIKSSQPLTQKNNKEPDNTTESDPWGTTIYTPITKPINQAISPNKNDKGKEPEKSDTLEPGEFNPNI